MSFPLSTVWNVSVAQQGQRLDKVLEALFPQWGLRARRRLCDAKTLGTVLVNGKARPAAYKVTVGDSINFVPHEHTENAQKVSDSMHTEDTICVKKHEKIYCVQQSAPWTFLYKPTGMHSVSLHKAYGMQGAVFEELCAPYVHNNAPVLLCNRLDRHTSGLMVMAHSHEAVQAWKDLEEAGLCEKRYVALVCGTLTQKLRVANALQVDKRKISRVLTEADQALRHTHFIPLGTLTAQDIHALAAFFPALCEHKKEDALSLVGCIIHKGARHQIRAHAAYSGLPLWHDTRYAQRCVPKEECFILHHGGVHISRGRVMADAAHCEQGSQENMSNSCGVDCERVCCLPPWHTALSSELHTRMVTFFEKNIV